MQTIVPHIWFDDDATSAAEFYLGAFPDSRLVEVGTYPAQAFPGPPRGADGQTSSVTLEIGGYRLTLINGGDAYSPTPAINFFVNFDPSVRPDATGDLHRVWSKLTDGGQVSMELGAYPFSSCYGWVQDRYGVNWELMLTNPAGDPRPFIIPNLMFCGAAQNRAREAVDHYLSVFSGAELASRVFYDQPDDLVTMDSVIFSDFQLAGEWLSATDSAVAQPFTFTPGLSLRVSARDQWEIDWLWSGLSAVPEAERRGWCVDRYGVSWQILPANLGELLARPGALEKFLRMTKVEIDQF